MKRLAAFSPAVAAAFTIATLLSTSPARAHDDGMLPRVKLETSQGDIVLELDAAKAPVTVQNFIQYVDSGYYNGTIFHRDLPKGMIHGGGYTTDVIEKKEGLRPPVLNEWDAALKNQRGSVALFRMSGHPQSGAAQFFINTADNGEYDRAQPDGAGYAVFGKVVEGLDTVDKIAAVKLKKHPSLPWPTAVTPEEAVVIAKATLATKFDREKVAAAAKAKVDAAAAREAEKKAMKDMPIEQVVKKLEDETKLKAEKHDSGLYSIILKPGSGESPKSTDTVTVHYTGWLVDGTKFDSSVDRGQPYPTTLDKVIKGWTIGVAQMKVGEKRKLIIPPLIGYGQRGSPPLIPANAILIFDVELLDIKKPQ